MSKPVMITATTAAIVVASVAMNKQLRLLLASTVAKVKLQLLQSSEASDGSKCVTAIYVYPVKSLKAVPVEKTFFDDYGMMHDRHLMVVRSLPTPNKGFFLSTDATHRFVSQRLAPSLTQIAPSLPSPDGKITLTVASDPKRTITVDVSKKALSSYKPLLAGVWDDVVQVVDVGDEAAAFVREVIAKDGETEGEWDDVRVVSMPVKDYHRTPNEKYVPYATMSGGMVPGVMLSDEYPILIASESSLAELNRRLKEKGKPLIDMSQFRPNIVIKGTEPFEEDTWKAIKIGDSVFHVVKGCPRCKQSCTNQETGKVSEEPLATLSEFRALGENSEDVFFCQNMIAQDASKGVRVGDPITVLTTGSPIFE